VTNLLSAAVGSNFGDNMDLDRAGVSEQARDGGPLSGRPWLSSYAPGVAAEVQVPAESLTEMLAASALRFGQQVALDFFGTETTYVLHLCLSAVGLGDAAERPPSGRGRLPEDVPGVSVLVS
jgi:hypothetical protein